MGGFAEGGKPDCIRYGKTYRMEPEYYIDNAAENDGQRAGCLCGYTPLIERKTAVKKETESFLNRVYHGSISMLINGFVERQRLSPKELLELRQILDRAEEGEHD